MYCVFLLFLFFHAFHFDILSKISAQNDKIFLVGVGGNKKFLCLFESCNVPLDFNKCTRANYVLAPVSYLVPVTYKFNSTRPVWHVAHKS